MNTIVFIAWDSSREQPLQNIIIDEQPLFTVALFDYGRKNLARYCQSRTITIISGSCEWQCICLSAPTEGKGEVLKHIANYAENIDYAYIGIFDDDVLIRISDINRTVSVGEASNFASFQPSLARSSYIAHDFTVNQPLSTARQVSWVEIMIPIIKTNLFLAATPFLSSNISSWGIDCYVLPMLAITENISGCHAVVDVGIATHLRRLRSDKKIYSNGLTARQELLKTKNSCLQYLVNNGIELHKCNALLQLFGFGS